MDNESNQPAASPPLQKYDSPYPLPEILKQYESNHPKLGIAKSIIELVQEQTKHRQQMEIKQFEAAREDQIAERMERKLGQILGFSIGVITIVTGGVVAVLGAQWPGGLIGTGGVIGLVAVFVIGRRMEANRHAKVINVPKPQVTA